MIEPFAKDWSLLGSNLWLRPVRSRDLKRLEAFLARRDLARSRGADARNLSRLLPWDSDPEATLKKGKALMATDAFGAPAGFFCRAHGTRRRSSRTQLCRAQGWPRGIS